MSGPDRERHSGAAPVTCSPTGLPVRTVELDFSEVTVRWNPDQPEYSHLLNAVSTMLPQLEQFISTAVRRADQQLSGPSHAGLHADVRAFLAQEAHHARNHRRFNQRLHNEGYEWLTDHERRLQADFERFSEQGVDFGLAYAEGFETFGRHVAGFFFESGSDLLGDLDQVTADLWRWHFAEEWEHRCVCNHLYRQLDGRYWYRLYGLVRAAAHVLGYTLPVAARFVATDLRRGVIANRRRSVVRFVVATVRLFSYVLPRMMREALDPRYDPVDLAPPAGAVDLLAAMSNRHGVRRLDGHSTDQAARRSTL